MYVVWLCLLVLLPGAIVHGQSNSQTSPLRICARTSSRMIDNVYQAAYQRGYDTGFNSAAANYGESRCSTEIPCDQEAIDIALAEARRQAQANRDAAIQEAIDEQTRSFTTDLEFCVPITNIGTCRDDTDGRCFYSSSASRCLPTSLV